MPKLKAGERVVCGFQVAMKFKAEQGQVAPTAKTIRAHLALIFPTNFKIVVKKSA